MSETGPREGPMDDDALASWLEQRVRTAVGYADTTLSRERELVGRYYDGDEPRPFHKGNSRYVSADVYDAVEAMKAELVETFTGNRMPVQFSPTGAEDVEEARIATEYTNYVVFGQNPGYFVLQDAIHDGLMYRVGVAQVWWRDDVREVEETYPSIDADAALAVLMGVKDLKDWDSDQNEDGTIDLHITRKVDMSQVVVEAVPPEEFGITPRAKSVESAEMVYRRTKKAKSDLIRAGYDPKVLEDIWQDEKVWLDTEPEIMQRFADVDGGSPLGTDDELQAARRKIMVYDVYVELDLEGTGTSDLYRVVYAGGTVLEKERVARKPFVAFCPLRRPHSFWGSAYAERVIPIQNARTLLRRAIIDHAVVTTNPRYTVLRGGLVNPKELIEQRVGGLVNITRPDAVMPLQQAPLNPFIFQTVDSLDADKEKLTGVSDLSQGLNKDAISKQNSQEMVQTVALMGQSRQKIMARNFAEGFLSELFLAVYQLVIENVTGTQVAEIAGNWVQVDPQSWRSRKNVQVEFALGYGEHEKEAAKWVQIDQYLMTHGGTQYGPKQAYKVRSKALNAMGVRDVGTYYLPPEEAPQAPPNPELVLQEREVAVKEQQVKLAMAKFQAEAQRKRAETGLKAQREGGSHSIAQQKVDLDVAKHLHDVDVDEAEIALQHEANQITANARPT